MISFNWSFTNCSLCFILSGHCSKFIGSDPGKTILTVIRDVDIDKFIVIFLQFLICVQYIRGFKHLSIADIVARPSYLTQYFCQFLSVCTSYICRKGGFRRAKKRQEIVMMAIVVVVVFTEAELAE